MEPNDAGGSLGPEIGAFVLRVFRLSWSGVRWTEGEELTRGGANDYSVLFFGNIIPLMGVLRDGH